MSDEKEEKEISYVVTAVETRVCDREDCCYIHILVDNVPIIDINKTSYLMDKDLLKEVQDLAYKHVERVMRKRLGDKLIKMELTTTNPDLKKAH